MATLDRAGFISELKRAELAARPWQWEHLWRQHALPVVRTPESESPLPVPVGQRRLPGVLPAQADNGGPVDNSPLPASSHAHTHLTTGDTSDGTRACRELSLPAPRP